MSDKCSKSGSQLSSHKSVDCKLAGTGRGQSSCEGALIFLLPLYLRTVHVQHVTRSSAHNFTLDAVDEETHGVTVSDHNDSHMFYFDRLAGWPTTASWAIWAPSDTEVELWIDSKQEHMVFWSVTPIVSYSAIPLFR